MHDQVPQHTQPVDFDLHDVCAIFKRTPYIGDLKPGGRYVAKDLYEVGGVPVLMKALLDGGYLHGDCITVTGKTVAENLKDVKFNPDQKVMVEVSTLDCGGSCSALSPISIAAVHEATPTACLAPTHRAKSDSNATTSGPLVTQPDASTRDAAWRARDVITVRANGMGCRGSSARAMESSVAPNRPATSRSRLSEVRRRK